MLLALERGFLPGAADSGFFHFYGQPHSERDQEPAWAARKKTQANLTP